MSNSSNGFEPKETLPALRAIDFSLEAARRYFTGERNKDGALTPIGHRWSNLIEQTENYYRTENPEARQQIKYSIARSVLDIREMKRRGTLDHLLPRSNPQLLLAFSAS